MTMTDYPTATDLAAMGVTLERDVCLWSLRLARAYGSTPPSPVLPRVTPEKQPAKVKFTKAIKGRRIG